MPKVEFTIFGSLSKVASRCRNSTACRQGLPRHPQTPPKPSNPQKEAEKCNLGQSRPPLQPHLSSTTSDCRTRQLPPQSLAHLVRAIPQSSKAFWLTLQLDCRGVQLRISTQEQIDSRRNFLTFARSLMISTSGSRLLSIALLEV
jgi:hypothetical protein